MAIDPMLYEKISGRSGDPMDAYGKSLAQDAKRDSERNTAVYYDEAPGASYFKAKHIVGIIGSLILFGTLLWAFFIRK